MSIRRLTSREKRYRSYFLWEYGKPPDVAIVKIISDLRGGELGLKMAEYARMGVHYYVIFDPARHFKAAPLRFFKLNFSAYEETRLWLVSRSGIGLALWKASIRVCRGLVVVGAMKVKHPSRPAPNMPRSSASAPNKSASAPSRPTSAPSKSASAPSA